MGTIRKRGDGYQVQVRRAGFPPQSKTLRTKKLALEWQRAVEAKIDSGTFRDSTSAKSTTFGDLLRLYLDEVTAKRRRAVSRSVEAYTINRILREEPVLCDLTMDKLRPEHIEDYRDRRKQSKSPYRKREDGTLAPLADSTVNRDLSIIKCVIDHANRDLRLSINPAAGIEVKSDLRP